MNNSIQKELPSQKIQKIYENNPSYILKKIRKENMIKESNFLPLSLEKDDFKNFDTKLKSPQKDKLLNFAFDDSKKMLNKIFNNEDNIEVTSFNNKINNNKIINNKINNIKLIIIKLIIMILILMIVKIKIKKKFNRFLKTKTKKLLKLTH